MTQNQVGWFYFAAGLSVIVALLVGDVYALIQSHGKPDTAFITGMVAHVSAVALAFKGGLKILPPVLDAVSDAKRAEL